MLSSSEITFPNTDIGQSSAATSNGQRQGVLSVTNIMKAPTLLVLPQSAALMFLAVALCACSDSASQQQLRQHMVGKWISTVDYATVIEFKEDGTVDIPAQKGRATIRLASIWKVLGDGRIRVKSGIVPIRTLQTFVIEESDPAFMQADKPVKGLRNEAFFRVDYALEAELAEAAAVYTDPRVRATILQLYDEACADAIKSHEYREDFNVHVFIAAKHCKLLDATRIRSNRLLLSHASEPHVARLLTDAKTSQAWLLARTKEWSLQHARALRDPEAAFALSSELMDTDPENCKFQNAHAAALAAVGEFDKAVLMQKKALEDRECEPMFGGYRESLAKYRFQQNSLKSDPTFVDRDTTNEKMMLRIGMALIQDPKEALERSAQLLASDPSNCELQNAHAAALSVNGDFDNAVTLQKKALKGRECERFYQAYISALAHYSTEQRLSKKYRKRLE